MYLDGAGEYFRLTWKGAILGAWRSIWPVSLVRRWWMRSRSEDQLRSMGVAAISADVVGQVLNLNKCFCDGSGFTPSLQTIPPHRGSFLIRKWSR